MEEDIALDAIPTYDTVVSGGDGREGVRTQSFTELSSQQTTAEQPIYIAKWCHNMDLVAVVTKGGQLGVHRLSWQPLFSAQVEEVGELPEGEIDYEHYEEHVRQQEAFGRTPLVRCMCWRPDGRMLALGLRTGAVVVYSLETGARVTWTQALDRPVMAMDWSNIADPAPYPTSPSPSSTIATTKMSSTSSSMALALLHPALPPDPSPTSPAATQAHFPALLPPRIVPQGSFPLARGAPLISLSTPASSSSSSSSVLPSQERSLSVLAVADACGTVKLFAYGLFELATPLIAPNNDDAHPATTSSSSSSPPSPLQTVSALVASASSSPVTSAPSQMSLCLSRRLDSLQIILSSSLSAPPSPSSVLSVRMPGLPRAAPSVAQAAVLLVGVSNAWNSFSAALHAVHARWHVGVRNDVRDTLTQCVASFYCLHNALVVLLFCNTVHPSMNAFISASAHDTYVTSSSFLPCMVISSAFNPSTLLFRVS